VIDYGSMAVFIPTFFLVSISPGMCMTLAMTMGMTVGVRKTLWMMAGELIGVGLVAVCAVVGVATMMLSYPRVFEAFKYVGGIYLAYIGIQMWRSRGKMALTTSVSRQTNKSNTAIAIQGFVTAVANPKGWAFMVSLLPSFISAQLSMAPQLIVLLSLVLLIEFCCLLIYANGGKQLGKVLQRNNNVSTLNKITGSLMIGVGAWLAFG
jgi:threonine/homoserine/homoserine lactone efflux protein